LDPRHSDRGRSDRRLARRPNVRLLASPASRVGAAQSSKMKAPKVVPGGGFRSVGAGHWGGGDRVPRTYSNARTGPLFPRLLVFARPLRNTRSSVAFSYFGLGAAVVGVQRPHGACPAVPAASEHSTDARCRRRTAQTGQRVRGARGIPRRGRAAAFECPGTFARRRTTATAAPTSSRAGGSSCHNRFTE
jgi:hypothetical protein